MNREPVNPDDPQMTAYALGELSASEAVEFEARLLHSPNAQRELEEMRQVMKLLGDGLAREWKLESESPSLKLLDPLPDNVLVCGDFRPVRRKFASLGAWAAAIAVSAIAFLSLSSVEDKTVEVAFSGDLVETELDRVDGVGGIHVPRLLLAEEVTDLAALDLVDAAEGISPSALDASYLDAKQVIPTAFRPSNGASLAERGAVEGAERVDSYLPPIHAGFNGRGFKSGMIERRLGKEANLASGSSSVVVRGYVTMGGGSATSLVSTAFQPVSISGNPVVNEESDLRLLADLNGLQRDLSDAIADLPEDSHERSKLEKVLERSQRLVSQLSREISN
jgi:hypothetical protein